MLSKDQKKAIIEAYKVRGSSKLTSILNNAGIKYNRSDVQATQNLFSEVLQVIQEYINMSTEPESKIDSKDKKTSTLKYKENNSVARTKAELDKITSELRRQGYSYTEIAKLTGKSRSSVIYRLQRISEETGEKLTSLSKMRNPKELFDEQDKIIHRLQREGKSKMEIAKILGVSRAKVDSRLNDEEIARRIKKMIDYGIPMKQVEAQANAAEIDITNALKLYEIYMSEQMER